MSDNPQCTTIIKGPWNNIEDTRLRELVEEYKSLYPSQPISWKFVEDRIQNRTSKQCRERWTNHLDNVNKSPLTDQEVRFIRGLRKESPSISYVQIAEKMPRRTPLIIKNFIYRERIKEKKSVLRIRQMMSFDHLNNNIT